MNKEKIIVYADGGSRGNPGPAAVGVVVCNEKGQKIKECGQKLEEISTNNEAEYEAVIFALKKLKQLFGKDKTKNLTVEFRVDSELIASQLSGEYKINEERMQLLFMKVWNLKFDFGRMTFKSIPREQNKRADELVNLALDGQGETVKMI
ncbi:MAG: ribonuclease HI family protein [Parcubacteria group bacterium]|nr:ribonuclease HI family protein [Parcubacteria group bacterium]